MALRTEVGLGPGYTVLDWDQAPLPQKRDGAPSQFSAHFYCGRCLSWQSGSPCGLVRSLVVSTD